MSEPQAVYLKDYQSPAYFIPKLHLTFDLFEEKTLVTARAQVRKNTGGALKLDGEELKLVSVKIDGTALTPAQYTVTPELLTIAAPPAEFDLEIVTEIRPQDNKAFTGLYKTKKIFCTQMEAQGFRRVTYYLDRPDVLSIYTTVINADKKLYPFLLSNGDRKSQKDLPDGRHQVEWHDPYPKPCYLFALVAGDLGLVRDHYKTASGRDVELEIYCDKGNEAKCAHAMTSLKEAMKWDEDTYKLEYDLGLYMVVAVDDFNMGAMENKGLNIFNSKYVLADQKSATDQEFMGIQSVIGHEYFHNWSGNRVTCRDWFQLSLKEGLTVFRDQEFSSDLHSRAVKRIEDVINLRTRQFPEDASGMAHPVRPPSYVAIDNFYTRTVYEKGAEVIRMLQTLLGRDVFIRGVQKYFELHDGQAVTTDDFIKAHEIVSGKDLSQFKRWYDQAGTPRLKISESFDASAKTYTITVAQSCVHPVTKEKNRAYHLPLKTGLLDSHGREIPMTLTTGKTAAPGVLDMREDVATFTFKNVSEKPVLSTLRDFSSPVQLEFDQPDRELIFLMEKDSDAFNRYESSQKLFKKVLLNAVTAFKNHKTPEFSADILAAMKRSLLQYESTDMSFLARLIAPPSANYLLQFCTPMEPQYAEQAYDFFNSTVQKALGNELQTVFKKIQNSPPTLDAVNINRRALKSVLLHYLAWKTDSRLLRTVYESAPNMSEAMTALMLVVHHDNADSRAVVDHFYQTWKDDALVLNKWFAAQALSLQKNTLENVRKLTAHPGFDVTNPNKVFSLHATFAQSNPFRFHDAGGKAYAFITEVILDVDSRNPQVAARLATSFNDWTRWSPELRTLAQKQLEKIHGAPKVSKNVFEIVDRALKMN